jgi:hypothetical protein
MTVTAIWWHSSGKNWEMRKSRRKQDAKVANLPTLAKASVSKSTAAKTCKPVSSSPVYLDLIVIPLIRSEAVHDVGCG